MGDFDIYNILLNLLIFIPSIGLHEYCHAKFADLAGDMTPRSQGRVTLNPLAHLDPVGTIMMVISSVTGFGIGWGKPVMVNPTKMRNPRWDHFVSVIMGPISNLGIALVCAIFLKLRLFHITMPGAGVSEGALAFSSLENFFAVYMLGMCYVNLSLFFFNLIPLGPLDGHWLVGALMPFEMRTRWYRFCHGPGMFIFLALILMRGQFDPIGRYLSTTVSTTFRLMVGI